MRTIALILVLCASGIAGADAHGGSMEAAAQDQAQAEAASVSAPTRWHGRTTWSSFAAVPQLDGTLKALPIYLERGRIYGAQDQVVEGLLKAMAKALNTEGARQNVSVDRLLARGAFILIQEDGAREAFRLSMDEKLHVVREAYLLRMHAAR